MTYKAGEEVKIKIVKAHEGLPQETGDFNAKVLGEYQIAGEPQIRVRVDHPGSGWDEWVLDCAAEMVSPR
jgi:hypothetical protein